MILRAGPVACFRAEFAAGGLSELVTYRTMQSLADWAEDVEQDTGRSGDDVRRMAHAEESVTGSLICTCEGDLVDGNLQPRSPFVVFDGFHRGAAWFLQGKAGNVYPISAWIIVTTRSSRLGRGQA